VVEAALYDPEDGFYTSGRGAPGRRGDFITSPEVGPLFGEVIARALDAWWREVGEPDPFVVVDAGAGTRALQRGLQAAAPACGAALQYVPVEHGDASPPAAAVVFANELLDNLPFDLVEDGDDVLVDIDASGRLVERSSGGPRVARQTAATTWLRDVLAIATRVVVLDYCTTTDDMRARPWTEWVRTYRAHERGTHPLDDPGEQDITCEVAVDQLAAVRPPDRNRSQAEFLRAHGIDELVEEGRRTWRERAHIGDLAAVRARSRVNEAAALTDPAGLGAFRVLEWVGDERQPKMSRRGSSV
jgi:SAM-dependent MidA family methyltransferase